MRIVLACLLCLTACDEEEADSDMGMHDLAGFDGAACGVSTSSYYSCLSAACCDSHCKGPTGAIVRDGDNCSQPNTNCEVSATTFVNCESDFKWHMHVFIPAPPRDMTTPHD